VKRGTAHFGNVFATEREINCRSPVSDLPGLCREAKDDMRYPAFDPLGRQLSQTILGIAQTLAGDFDEVYGDLRVALDQAPQGGFRPVDLG
jgi:hypothetical protein